MKRLLVPLIIVAVAATVFLNRGRFLPQAEGHLNYLGYVEGETRLIAAPEPGRLAAVDVQKGQAVRPDEALFALDPAQASASLAAAEAQLQAARATHQNLLSGKRREEIAVIHAQVAQAEAGLELAQKELERASSLASTGTAARSRLDQASEQVTTFQQRIAELKASEKVAGLPARTAEIDAAQSRIREAEAQVDAASERFKDLSPVAPVGGLVEDVFFKAGEWVAAGQPVVSLLDPTDITIRFFVPQAVLAKAAPGTRITYQCDGCSGPKTATIVHVASQPEYTPPVIYSETARAKLVFLVEAKPDAGDSELRPGLPIAVEPLP